VGGVEDGLSVAPGYHEPRVHHPVQVVAQRRPGDVELLLQMGRRHALGARLDDGTKDGQASHVAQRGELVGVPFDGLHVYVSRLMDAECQVGLGV